MRVSVALINFFPGRVSVHRIEPDARKFARLSEIFPNRPTCWLEVTSTLDRDSHAPIGR